MRICGEVKSVNKKYVNVPLTSIFWIFGIVNAKLEM